MITIRNNGGDSESSSLLRGHRVGESIGCSVIAITTALVWVGGGEQCSNSGRGAMGEGTVGDWEGTVADID